MDLAKLISSIHEAADHLSGPTEVDPQQRLELFHACEKLSAIVELPRSKLEKATHAGVHHVDVK
ncbi:hypothetical protein N7454_004408 [Penicillium verhagenii]|nr:hypothetical protein N7454_004408 [Penicillium verhagenii]